MKTAVGIDIGGTITKIGLVSEEGVCIKKTSFRTKEETSFSSYINKLVNYFDKVVWLNPEQSQNWQYSQSTMILRDLLKKNMFQMNLKGIESAMKNLI